MFGSDIKNIFCRNCKCLIFNKSGCNITLNLCLSCICLQAKDSDDDEEVVQVDRDHFMDEFFEQVSHKHKHAFSKINNISSPHTVHINPVFGKKSGEERKTLNLLLKFESESRVQLQQSGQLLILTETETCSCFFTAQEDEFNLLEVKCLNLLKSD